MANNWKGHHFDQCSCGPRVSLRIRAVIHFRTWAQEVPGSNPGAPTKSYSKLLSTRSVLERWWAGEPATETTSRTRIQSDLAVFGGYSPQTKGRSSLAIVYSDVADTSWLFAAPPEQMLWHSRRPTKLRCSVQEFRPQHFLYFRPLPQEQGSLRPGRLVWESAVSRCLAQGMTLAGARWRLSSAAMNRI